MEIYVTSFTEAVKDINLQLGKTAALFVFKIRIPLDSTSCGTFGRYHRRKFKKNTDKDTKTVTHKRICFGIYSFSFLFLARKKRS